MISFLKFFLISLFLTSSTTLFAQSTNGNISIDDSSIKEVPEPIKCYSFLSELTGDKEMPVGLAIDLCAGTKNAKKTLICYKTAFELLELSRGLAIELCNNGRKLH